MRRALDRERAARVFGSEGRWRHVVERCGGVRARVRWSGVVSARRDLVFVRLLEVGHWVVLGGTESYNVRWRGNRGIGGDAVGDFVEGAALVGGGCRSLELVY